MADWHRLEVASVLQRLGTDASSGLSQASAARRLAEWGPNEVHALRGISTWAVFLRQLRNVLILILLAVTALSVFLGHGAEALAIVVIILFAVLLGFAQEYRSERALEALRRMAAPRATALRDGEETIIPARTVVPGDVILLRSGDKVAADSRLIEAVNLQIEESALTGESVPVEKVTKALGEGDWPVQDRKNMAYAGTAATYGRGRR